MKAITRVFTSFLATGLMAGCGLAQGPAMLPYSAAKPVTMSYTATQTDPFELILAQSRKALEAGKRPMVVFDLDDTLFRTAPRTLRIVHEWALTPIAASHRQTLLALGVNDMRFSLEAVLKTAGIPEALWPDAKAFWEARFFTSPYLHEDTPYPGAVRFVERVKASGAKVVYLTGRWEAMREGTVWQLQNRGFPLRDGDPAIQLLIKPQKEIKDMDFKATALKGLAQQGEIVALIDNEPRNVNAMHALLPDALTVFLDKPHSPDAPAVDPGILKAVDFPQAALASTRR